jgi:hypothetical protein
VSICDSNNTPSEALERKIDHRTSDSQAPHYKPVQANGQLRPLNVDLSSPTIDSEA